jgi:flagellin
MTVINTNTASMIARDAIQRNDRAMSTAMERLSTGSRINSAKDDAAGMAISDRMSAQISGLNMAVRNANDAISMLQTAEGATKEISNMLGRMRELAVQSASGTYSDADRASLDLEFGALMDEITRIADNTEWNGNKILAGAVTATTAPASEATYDKTIQLGASSGQTMAISLNSWQPKVALDAQMSAASGTGADGVDPKTGMSKLVTLTQPGSNDVINIAGLTITADGTGSGTLAELEAALIGTTAGTKPNDVGTKFIFTGALTGFNITDTGNNSDGKLIFTSTGGANSAATLAAATGTGANHAVITDDASGTENAGAYGTATLHFGSAAARINITSDTNASTAISQLDLALNGAAAERAKYGAYMSRLQHASDNLSNVATNTAASRSQIADADYATETTELARTQIISQASTAMLAQANQVKQTVLALLQ